MAEKSERTTKETMGTLIKKEIGIQLAKITEEDKTAGKTTIGSIKMEQIVKIAKSRRDMMLAKTLKSAVKQVVGTASSMQGMLVEGKKPNDVIKEISEGRWDSLIKG